MELEQLAIFVFCLIGCGWSCWTLGHKSGIADTVAWLADEGIITVEEEDD